MSENILINPLGENFKLDRYPIHGDLKAWDAADELILQELKTNSELANKKILVINDSFGALSLALKNYDLTTYTDSFVSYMAMKNADAGLNIVNDLSLLKNGYDLVVIKVPKSLSFFEDILATLGKVLASNVPIIFGCMVKYLTKGYFDLIEKYIGDTKTSLAQKKARLVFASFNRVESVNPYPQKIYIDLLKTEFTNHSNLFSRNKLDIGTRFFLEHIPEGKFKTILDLGCANGIIGIAAKKLNPLSEIIFSDESFMAIKSSKENYQKFQFKDEATFLWTNCYEKPVSATVDLILCNPPFHQNNTIGDFIALQMFQDSKNALVRDGQIRVIGNTHLGYHQTLKKMFGNSTIVAKNSKFMIVDAFKK